CWARAFQTSSCIAENRALAFLGINGFMRANPAAGCSKRSYSIQVRVFMNGSSLNLCRRIFRIILRTGIDRDRYGCCSSWAFGSSKTRKLRSADVAEALNNGFPEHVSFLCWDRWKSAAQKSRHYSWLGTSRTQNTRTSRFGEQPGLTEVCRSSVTSLKLRGGLCHFNGSKAEPETSSASLVSPQRFVAGVRTLFFHI